MDFVQHVLAQETVMTSAKASGLLRRISSLFVRRASAGRVVTAQILGLGPLDYFLHLDGDVWISDVIARGEVFDAHILKIMRALVAEGDTFIDVGANIGWFSVIGSRLVGAGGRVLSFEPSPQNMALAEKSVARNGCRNVTLFRAALGSEKRQARLFLSGDNQGDHRLAGSPLGRDFLEVDVIPLDDVLERLVPLDDHGAVFAKIDTQGSETAVLSGMRGLLGSGRTVRLALEFWPQGLESCGSSAPALLAELARERWTVWLIHPGGELEPSSLERLHELVRTDYGLSTGLFTDVLLLAEDDDDARRAVGALA